MKTRILPVWVYVALVFMDSVNLAASRIEADKPAWLWVGTVIVGIAALAELCLALGRVNDR